MYLFFQVVWTFDFRILLRWHLRTGGILLSIATHRVHLRRALPSTNGRISQNGSTARLPMRTSSSHDSRRVLPHYHDFTFTFYVRTLLQRFLEVSAIRLAWYFCYVRPCVWMVLIRERKIKIFRWSIIIWRAYILSIWKVREYCFYIVWWIFTCNQFAFGEIVVWLKRRSLAFGVEHVLEGGGQIISKYTGEYRSREKVHISHILGRFGSSLRILCSDVVSYFHFSSSNLVAFFCQHVENI